MKTEVAQYVASSFKEGNCIYAVTLQGEDIVIELSCLNLKLESMWAGEWQSTWTVSGGKVSGDLKIKSHYFEMGNMQFNLDKQFDSIPVKDITSAKDIVAAI